MEVRDEGASERREARRAVVGGGGALEVEIGFGGRAARVFFFLSTVPVRLTYCEDCVLNVKNNRECFEKLPRR